jgi:15-cis-phytoene synthase
MSTFAAARQTSARAVGVGLVPTQGRKALVQRRVAPHSLTPSFEYPVRGPVVSPLGADEQLAAISALLPEAAWSAPTNATATVPQVSLAEAYLLCQQITRRNSKSFFLSTQLLPRDKRRAVRVLYAFCRTSDDAVDLADGDPAAQLAAWIRQVWQAHPPEHPVLVAWRDTCRRYNLAPRLANELLAGVAMDLALTRYASFADLWLYCYRVASVVGLLSMQIIGSGPGAEAYAIKLGVALQLTNILRDVAEDAARGRIYLPQDELAAFGVTDEAILNGVCDERVRALMRFQVERAHRLYDESWPGIALLPSDGRFAVGVAATVYRGILDKIAAADYDPFCGRAHLTLREKLNTLPHTWVRVRALSR